MKNIFFITLLFCLFLVTQGQYNYKRNKYNQKNNLKQVQNILNTNLTDTLNKFKDTQTQSPQLQDFKKKNLNKLDTLKNVIGLNGNHDNSVDNVVVEAFDPSDTISENDILDFVPAKSLRLNYGFINNNEETDYTPDEIFPIEEQKIRHEDAVFSEILLEEIDCREKINLPFIYKGKDENGTDQRLFVLLVKAVSSGGITAFEDDKFTTPKQLSKLRSELKGTKELVLVDNPNDPNIKDTAYIFNTKLAIKTDSVYIFRLKVHYIFDKKTSVFYKRILGIAPIARFAQYGDVKISTTSVPIERTVFWLYYPDIKAYLSKQYVYNPFNLTKKMTWEELFNARLFSSYFIKTTHQNFQDEKISQFIKDPYWRLLKSEQIKHRIYDWESDRWEY
ncbi:MAG: gliding motility protein GldN [Alphaproteobacteria bacterium]|nr:gliding motility protein GldN [Alphaproteobacteria bacterium]